MLAYPHFNPVLLQIGPVAIHWYGMMYIFGIGTIWYLLNRKAKLGLSPLNEQQTGDLIFYGACGVIFGARIGYMLFYNFPELIHHPLSLFMVWQGGMSFHGGVIGVAIAFYIFHRQVKQPLLVLSDLIVPLVPIALAFGRFGNFINGELWGRVATVPWAMIFPNGGPLPRHPSQLYELSLEGILLFIIMQVYTRKPRQTGQASALFLMCYAAMRVFAECFREPDVQLGFLAFNWLTMGQLLSFCMLLAGVVIMLSASKQKISK